MSAKALDTETVQELRAQLGTEAVLTDNEALQRYGADATQPPSVDASVVIRPKSIEQIQWLAKYASAHKLPLVPSGGRSGLSGGALARRGEVIVAMDRFNHIDSFSEIDLNVRCGAGVTTAALQQFAIDHGLFYPVDFASSGSSQIGGNIATNAGGIKVLRYGMTRDWVRGIRLVTGSGELLDLNRGLIKNNAGYDLRHLVIGAEGTLGIVVDATLRLALPPSQQQVALLAVTDLHTALGLHLVLRRELRLSAVECFDQASLDHVAAQGQLSSPLQAATPWYVLLEFDAEHAEAAELLLADAVADGRVVDAVFSRSVAQADRLWRLREDISGSLAAHHPWKHDIAVRLSQIPTLVERVEELLSQRQPDWRVVWFGHVGDGNLHLNILPPAGLAVVDFRDACDTLAESVYAVVGDLGGSVAAEHGIGLLKKKGLPMTRSSTEIALMREIKRVFDPAGIMNPGKVFDAS